MAITLKTNTFLTLDEVKAWLRIPLTSTDYDEVVKRLINVATDQAEQYIEGPIKTNRYVEQHDGTSTDTIVPHHFPVTSVEEIKVEYNRNYAVATPVAPTDYAIRGISKFNNTGGDFALNIKGTDIVFGTTNSSPTIIGSTFGGDAVQSIRVTYEAGYGTTQDELPADLVHATLMQIEYLYILRENRELGVRSKTVREQTYSREGGMPVEVKEILDKYRDITFGCHNQPQKNYSK